MNEARLSVRVLQAGISAAIVTFASSLAYLFLGGWALVGGAIIAGVIGGTLIERLRLAIALTTVASSGALLLSRRALATGTIEWLTENAWGRTAVPGDIISTMFPSSRPSRPRPSMHTPVSPPPAR